MLRWRLFYGGMNSGVELCFRVSFDLLPEANRRYIGVVCIKNSPSEPYRMRSAVSLYFAS
jgi:hypothetical protein